MPRSPLLSTVARVLLLIALFVAALCGESKPKVFAEELPRWTSGGMARLVRRRDAEVKLANEKRFP